MDIVLATIVIVAFIAIVSFLLYNYLLKFFKQFEELSGRVADTMDGLLEVYKKLVGKDEVEVNKDPVANVEREQSLGDNEDRIVSDPFVGEKSAGEVKKVDKDFEDYELEDVRGMKYLELDLDTTAVFPVIDEGDMPLAITLPIELIYVIRKEFELEDYGTPIRYKALAKFLKDNDITLGRFKDLDIYVKAKKDRGFRDKLYGQNDFNLATGLGLNLSARDAVWVSTINQEKVIRFMRKDNNGVSHLVEKVTGSVDLYQAYINKFGNIMVQGIPTEEEINKFIDDFTKRSLRDMALMDLPKL